MTVKPDTTLRPVHEGKIYLFCNPKCLAKFSADPEKYLHPAPPTLAATTISAGGYTCPMDPEVHQDIPGAISKNASYFNSHRMMRRYATEAYAR